MARMVPREVESVSERTGLPGEETCKALWGSSGLDTALYENLPLPFKCKDIYSNKIEVVLISLSVYCASG